MLVRMLISLSAITLIVNSVAAQTPAAGAPMWRPPAGVAAPEVVAPAVTVDRGVAPADVGDSVLRTASLPARAPLANVTKGTGTLPNDQGQVWREYDITPYTMRVTSTARPEQAIVDWLLRETGYEAWHSETVSMLSADRRTLRVYHTPAIQQTVSDVVDRFVNTQAQSNAFGVQVMSLTSPNWRAMVQPMLHPVQVQTAGVQAWLLAKEDAATLLVALGRRNDFRTHSSPHLIVNNGQPGVITLGQPHNYVRGMLDSDGRVAPQPDVAQVFEGFSLEMNPLLSLDGKMVDMVIKCNIDQIEKMIPVRLDVPAATPGLQVRDIQVPQLSSARMQERFRWPIDKVLLISLGVVPSPLPGLKSPFSLPLTNSAPRADILLLFENKGPVAAAAGASVGTAVAPTPAGGARFVR